MTTEEASPTRSEKPGAEPAASSPVWPGAQPARLMSLDAYRVS